MGKMIEQAYRFQLNGEPVSCTAYGNGHINSTYLLTDSSGSQYILQNINKNIFHDPESLMKNIAAVTTHLQRKGLSAREVLTLVPTVDSRLWHVDADGVYWRIYHFIEDSVCLEQAGTQDEFRESGVAFGNFQRQLADFPAHTLIETIPRFHDTPNRYAMLHAAVNADSHGRVKEAMQEIEFALLYEDYADTLIRLQNSGEMPLRVTHNDTKLNNVLLDRHTRKTLCVIDLDTVMPGLSVNDFGDSIRFGASTGAEDERELDKVQFSLQLYEAYADGFLSACGESLTQCEKEHLRDGAKMMTLECGVRFLEDYLSGDKYFRTSRSSQNLDRCRTQFKLTAEMDKKWSQMKDIVCK